MVRPGSGTHHGLPPTIWQRRKDRLSLCPRKPGPAGNFSGGAVASGAAPRLEVQRAYLPAGTLGIRAAWGYSPPWPQVDQTHRLFPVQTGAPCDPR